MRQHILLERAVSQEPRAFRNFQDRSGRFETACYILHVELPRHPKPSYLGVDTHELPGVLGLLEQGVTLLGATHYTPKKPGFFESHGYVEILHTQNRVVKRDISQMAMHALLAERAPMTATRHLLTTDPADIASLVHDRLLSLYRPELYVAVTPSGTWLTFDAADIVRETARLEAGDVTVTQYTLSGNRIKTLDVLLSDLRRTFPEGDVLTS